MIACPICSRENNDLAVICVQCGGYLQSRVPTLDLFPTMWQIIESPTRATKKIALAEHKNYSFILSAFVGIAVVYALLWLFNLGERFDNLMYLLFTGILLGPGIGITFLLLLSFVLYFVSRLLKGEVAFKNIYAVTTYAFVPIIFSLVFVFPIEIMTFGLFFFASNPSPLIIKPFSYIVMTGFNGLTALWSFVLLVLGLRTANNFSLWKSILATLLSLGVFLAFVVFVVKNIAQ